MYGNVPPRVERRLNREESGTHLTGTYFIPRGFHWEGIISALYSVCDLLKLSEVSELSRPGN